MKCARCGKPLLNPASIVAGQPIGPKCYRAMFGAKVRRIRATKATEEDERQMDIFRVIPNENPELEGYDGL